jgi:hypothetical protein
MDDGEEPIADDEVVAFSDRLETWLTSEGTKTVADLDAVVAEKSFAVTVLLLMFPSALPLPTGGITQIFETITLVVAFQMLIGRRTLWLPGWARRRELGALATEKGVPFVIRRIRWFERFSRPRGIHLFRSRPALAGHGVVIAAFAAGSFFAPPFSGLDTLPALGVVVVSLAIILEDVVVYAIGAAIGATGVLLTITLGAAAVRLFERIL